jgi:asparagine synthase (glutamine-hydrolysing)
MCGIAGYWNISQAESHDYKTSLATQMISALQHRGPDDSGIWIDSHSGVTLAHRRLSIVDLSSSGHQPMISENKRFIIVFNGEIYNFRDLKRQLEDSGVKFRGNSDTEVMLASFCTWGVQASVERFRGMFAFAVWDQDDQCLYLCKDRTGEKPLYYGLVGDTLVFASELKALTQHPNWTGEIERDALPLYMRYNCIPAPFSIYRGVYKLLPGTILAFKHPRSVPVSSTYWSAQDTVVKGLENPLNCTDLQAVEQLHSLLKSAIGEQMLADVPLGAFLSGGVDSSLIVALMQQQSSNPVKTFSIGFDESEYNEANYAKNVSQWLKTDHTELYVSSAQSLDVIEKLPNLYDEPFADSSQIPTFLVSQLAKRDVTVSLSGDGGDELFGGYNRYLVGQNIWDKISWIPSKMRQAVASGITVLSPQNWDDVFTKYERILPSKFRAVLPGEKLHKLASVLASVDSDSMYLGLTSHWQNPENVILNSSASNDFLIDEQSWSTPPNFTELMMYRDLINYLPNDILVKLDRASMGVSLESRIPFLDQRVVEFSWRIPLSMKIRNGQSKWILRQILYQYVPRDLIERPKMGFGVPIDTWLRGPLRDWAEDLLSESRLINEGFFSPLPIRQKWSEHLSGKRNWQHHLWDVLMFQSWLSSKK